jgi:hypothetical protein
MKIIADTNTFIAVALNEPEKEFIISLTEGHDLVAPEVLPFGYNRGNRGGVIGVKSLFLTFDPTYSESG